MPTFTVPIHEHNDCHSPEDGRFCSEPGPASPPGKGKRPRPGRVARGTGYKIMFRSQDPDGRGLPGTWFTRVDTGTARELELTSDEVRKIRSAKVLLRFDSWATAQLGAPIRWTAPNGVTVVYLRGQRRSRSGAGVYHDFDASSQEAVVPLTRNVGPGRRALRAWAAEHIEDKSVARFKARQLVRPGD